MAASLFFSFSGGGATMAAATPFYPLLHSDKHLGNCANEGDISGTGDGLSGSPEAAAIAAAVVAMTAATETTGETAHDCHPADCQLQTWCMGRCSWVGVPSKMSTAFYSASFRQAHWQVRAVRMAPAACKCALSRPTLGTLDGGFEPDS